MDFDPCGWEWMNDKKHKEEVWENLILTFFQFLVRI